MGHASAIEAALRFDETIGITDEQRRQVANLLAQQPPVGARPRVSSPPSPNWMR